MSLIHLFLFLRLFLVLSRAGWLFLFNPHPLTESPLQAIICRYLIV
nr:MAG TPA: hypothetical protein [Caudoviricetes sp.]